MYIQQISALYLNTIIWEIRDLHDRAHIITANGRDLDNNFG